MNTSDIYAILSSNLSETFYANIGSTWVFDTIYLFVIPLIGFFALLLNCISYGIFSRIGQQKNLSRSSLYYYLKIHSLFSVLISIILIFQFSTNAPRYFEYAAVSLYSRVFRCLFINYIATTFVVMGNMIDLLILIERLQIIDTPFARLFTRSPRRNVLISTVASFVINLPIYFITPIKYDDELYADIASLNVTQAAGSFMFCGASKWIHSPTLGRTLVFLTVTIKDVCLFVCRTGGSIWLCIRFNRFRADIRARRTTNGDTAASEHKQHAQITLMIISLVAFSLLDHSVLLLLCAIYMFTEKVNAYLKLATMLVGSVKLVINVIVFYNFDNNFRNMLLFNHQTKRHITGTQ